LEASSCVGGPDILSFFVFWGVGIKRSPPPPPPVPLPPPTYVAECQRASGYWGADTPGGVLGGWLLWPVLVWPCCGGFLFCREGLGDHFLLGPFTRALADMSALGLHSGRLSGGVCCPPWVFGLLCGSQIQEAPWVFVLCCLFCGVVVATELNASLGWGSPCPHTPPHSSPASPRSSIRGVAAEVLVGFVALV